MNTEQFIKQFADADIHALALKADKYPDVDMSFALNQILGRQKALRKLPVWAATEGVIYPPHISMEQCSSEFTAIYKRNILHRIIDGAYSLTDLTGGFGVDFIYMSENCKSATYVERKKELCDVVEQNIKLFGRKNVEIINSEAEQYLVSMKSTDVIYADPARRDNSGARTYAISDCTPDVIDLLPQLLDKAKYVLIKLSPMLDHNKTIEDLNHVAKCVKEVHIVSTAGECKELLVLLSSNAGDEYEVHCVNDNDEFVYTSSNEQKSARITQEEDLVDAYIYEPNASIMKSGCFGQLSYAYNVSVIARNSNIFVSREKLNNFPGRAFHVISTTTMNKKELSRALSGIKKANITVRNFPMSVSDLRKRLKLKDGGEIYIFATTTSTGSHVLLICNKA